MMTKKPKKAWPIILCSLLIALCSLSCSPKKSAEQLAMEARLAQLEAALEAMAAYEAEDMSAAELAAAGYTGQTAAFPTYQQVLDGELPESIDARLDLVEAMIKSHAGKTPTEDEMHAILQLLALNLGWQVNYGDGTDEQKARLAVLEKEYDALMAPIWAAQQQAAAAARPQTPSAPTTTPPAQTATQTPAQTPTATDETRALAQAAYAARVAEGGQSNAPADKIYQAVLNDRSGNPAQAAYNARVAEGGFNISLPNNPADKIYQAVTAAQNAQRAQTPPTSTVTTAQQQTPAATAQQQPATTQQTATQPQTPATTAQQQPATTAPTQTATPPAQAQTGTLNNPEKLTVQRNLGNLGEGSGWQELLLAIEAGGKFVDLDLSACTMAGTDFNPNSAGATGKDKIVSIALPNAATRITGRFMDYSSLRSFSGTGLTQIGSYAFMDCTSLTQTTLPAGLTTIADRAFQDCTNLALTSLPQGIVEIGSGAFNGCTNLALTSLPAGLQRLGGGAFNGCRNLALTSLPAGLTGIISDSTFAGCAKLAITELPAGITQIARYAFENCTSLTRITLPAGIFQIYQGAFQGCTNLALVTCHATIPPVAWPAIFARTHASLRIEVPAASVGAYKAPQLTVNGREGTNWWSMNYEDKIFAMR
jgi:hypothetical protein